MMRAARSASCPARVWRRRAARSTSPRSHAAVRLRRLFPRQARHRRAHGGRLGRGVPPGLPRARGGSVRHGVRQRRGPVARLPERAAQDHPRRSRRPSDGDPDLRRRPRAARRGGARRGGLRARVHRHQLRLLGSEDRAPRRRRRLAARSGRDGRDGEDARPERVASGHGEDAHRVGPREPHADRRSRAPSRGRRRTRAHDPLPHRADGIHGPRRLELGGARARSFRSPSS